MRSLIVSLLMLSGLTLVYEAAAQTAPGMKLTSTTFKDGDTVPLSVVYDKMGCKGKNTSPELSWSGAPAGTKSFAVTLYDPDANTGSGFWHWVMFDIPANVTHLAEGAGDKGSKGLPKGAKMGRNDFGDSHFDGPCPPPTDAPHAYQYTVYALKVDKLPVDENASGAMVGNYIQKNVLGKATIVGKSDGKKDHGQ
ncbi:MAG TPA: YbhB/YbcL family Raf kinase inhibitor-like protein [Gammaproteobacteria bacterium]|nr:YbhB/YbcL family Raf kinase inhibitor-like protein [Gammaproteobacteria bacterium]